MNKIGSTFSELYPEIIDEVWRLGAKSSPRGMPIHEIIGYQFKTDSIKDSVPLQKSRKMNYRFGIMEGLMLIWGHYPPDIVLAVNPKLKQFMRDENHWDGAYPPRIRQWVPHIVELLKSDPDSRRAVIPIYGDADLRLESADIACTTTLQFLIRNGKLNLIASMRSNDVFWGTANDVAQFTVLQRGIASALGIPTGWYQHFAGSMHIYENVAPDLLKVLEAEITEEYADFKHPEWPPLSIERQREQIDLVFEGFYNKGAINPNLIEPFHTYAQYLFKIKPIIYASRSIR